MLTLVDEIFFRAIELPATERAAFIADACNEDTKLREEVARLLEAHQDTEAFEGPVGRASTADSGEWIGKEIGPYTIRSRLGSGGFGQVFLAERTDEYRQRVAIKMLKAGVFGGGLDRFEKERQLLADLQHTNIARFYYGGRLSDGRCYIVMEYVDGLPITDHSRHSALGVPACLSLFRQVCHAVAYAHSYGVIHRDIKPANVLVNSDGDAKLLDFGIAKQVVPGRADATATLLSGFAPFTPQYASPEQIQQKRLSAASDVYALGLLLYEVLTGERPYIVQGESLAEISQVVCHHEPVRPSLRVLGDGPDGTRPARSETAKQLRGDLDQIVLKALEKDPRDRYSTVEALLADLESHQEGRTVKARPLPPAARFYRVCRRRPIVASLAAGLTLSLVVFSFISTWQLRAIQREERRRIDVQLQRLAEAPPAAVPALLEDLSEQPRAIARGRKALADPKTGEKESTRYRLMLLPNEPRQSVALRQEVLRLPIEEALLCVKELQRYQPMLNDDGWGDPPGAPGAWLRWAGGVVATEPNHTRIDPRRLAETAAAEAEENPAAVSLLSSVFAPLTARLHPELLAIASDRKRPATASSAALRLAIGLSSDAPERLAETVCASRTTDLRMCVSEIGNLGHARSVGDALASEAVGVPKESGREAANAAIALALWGRVSDAVELLVRGDDPSARHRFVVSASVAGLSITEGVEWLDAALPPQLAQAPALLLGSLGRATSSADRSGNGAERIKQLRSRLSHLVKQSRSPGVWAAAIWARETFDPAAVGVLPAARASLRSGVACESVSLAVNGHVMLDLEPGKLPVEPGKRKLPGGLVAKAPRPNRIDLPAQIAVFETTVEQYRAFDPAWNPGDGKAEPQHPVYGVSAQMAAAYCNWLSEQAEIPRSEYCYVAETEGGPLSAALDLTTRRGFRLPTETEWEYACRAGTTDWTFFGDDRELLQHFATIPASSPLGNKHAVGTRMPGPNGLFDMYGNADEICDDDPGRELPIRPNGLFVTRGGAAGDLYQPGSVGGNLDKNDPNNPGAYATGFRVCRTRVE